MVSIKIFVYNNAFVILLLGISIGLIILGLLKRRTLTKQIFFNLGAIFISLLAYEIYLGYYPKVKDKYIKLGSVNNDYSIKDKLLGYKLSKDSMDVTSIKLNLDSSKIYDVKYTIRNRYRDTPNSNTNSDKCVIFLGGSFIFGEGLNDYETLPYFFNKFSNREYEIRNYGLGGYGTHQALAIVDNEILKDSLLLKKKEISVYYLIISAHIWRAAGNAPWDPDGPNFEIENDKVVFKGAFSENKKKKPINKNRFKKLVDIWQRSNIFINYFRNKVFYSDYDVKRTILMVKKMNDLLYEKDIKFNVIFNQDNLDHETFQPIKERLNKEQINYIEDDDIYQEFSDNLELLNLRDDGHSTKLYNKLLAKKLIDNLNKN